MVKEVRIRVAEAKQRDAGKGKARIDDEVMHPLNIVAGDIISIKGKRTTAAVAWPAYPFRVSSVMFPFPSYV